MPDSTNATLSCREPPIGGAGVNDPAVEIGDDLHIHAADAVLATEQVGAVTAFTGRGDEPIEQYGAEAGAGGDSLGDDRGGLLQQRPQPPRRPRDGRLGATEQLTGDVLDVVVAQQEQGQHDGPR